MLVRLLLGQIFLNALTPRSHGISRIQHLNHHIRAVQYLVKYQQHVNCRKYKMHLPNNIGPHAYNSTLSFSVATFSHISGLPTSMGGRDERGFWSNDGRFLDNCDAQKLTAPFRSSLRKINPLPGFFASTTPLLTLYNSFQILRDWPAV